MTAQITRSTLKNQKLKKVQGGWENCENMFKFPQYGLMAKFWQFFLHFSAPLHFFQFLLFQCTSCDLCGHFEYNKPMFYDKKYFDPPLRISRFSDPPYGGVFTHKNVNENRVIVKHNQDNYFGTHPYSYEDNALWYHLSCSLCQY